MRIDRFTAKLQEALQSAHDAASQRTYQEITNGHLLLGLLGQSEGIAAPLLESVGVNLPALKERLDDELSRRPKVTGAEVYLGSENCAPCSRPPRAKWRSSRGN